jgi:hypothetical protein
MSPLLSRRRSRRRSIRRRLVPALILLLIVGVLVGGLAEVSRQSTSFHNGINRSLAAQGAVVADQSNVTSSQLRQLMADMDTLDRQALQADVDSVVQQTSQQSSLAERAADPAPDGSLAARFVAVFADRAEAVHHLQAAVDALLGMHPLPITGASSSVTGASIPTLLTSTQATDRIAAAGALLVRSDKSYRAVRSALARTGGRGRLPPSVWVTNTQTWQLGAVAEQVDLVVASSSLAVVHHLVLQTVRITPPALPTAVPLPAGTSVLTPTSSVAVTVVLSNLGSVDEPDAAVRFSLLRQGAGAAVTLTRGAFVASGHSLTLATATFTVRPGHSYQLTVSIVLPSGQTSVANTSMTQVLQIAPGT